MVFDIPPSYGAFTATGTGPVLAGRTEYSWLYRVQVDGKQVYESPRLDNCPGQRVDIRIELPAGCKKLTLLTDGLENADGDHAFWANAKLTLAKASPEI